MSRGSRNSAGFLFVAFFDAVAEQAARQEGEEHHERRGRDHAEGDERAELAEAGKTAKIQYEKKR